MGITVKFHEAKTHLSRLVEQAAKGQEFVIANAGRSMLRVVPVAALPATRTLGFLSAKGIIKADLKTVFADDIEAMFSQGR